MEYASIWESIDAILVSCSNAILKSMVSCVFFCRITHYASQSDIQTAAMLSCIFGKEQDNPALRRSNSKPFSASGVSIGIQYSRLIVSTNTFTMVVLFSLYYLDLFCFVAFCTRKMVA